LLEISGDTFQLIGTQQANKEINKERAAANQKLKDEKRRLLEKIRDDRIGIYKGNKSSYQIKAASALSIEAENYYREMADFFDCKSRITSQSFSTENIDWVDPDCDEVELVLISDSEVPSGIAFYNAALRKIKNPNYNYQAAGKEFANYALAYEPYNVDYLYLRSKFDLHGTPSNIQYLKMIIEIEPNNIRVNEELSFSIAKQTHNIETYEKYLEENPNGFHRSLAQDLYENLIETRNNLRLYNKYIADVNENLLLKNYAEASRIHKLAVNNSEYSKTDVKDIKAIEDYDAFIKAYENDDYNLLISYLNSVDYHRFADKAREKIGSISLSLGKSYFDGKKYRPAISAYENYKKYKPKGDKYTYAEEQIAMIEHRMRLVRNVNRWSITYIPQITEETSSALGIRVGLGKSFYIGFATSYFSMQKNKDLISSNWTAVQDPNSESYIFYNPNYYQSNNGQGSELSFIDPSIKTTGKLIRSLDKVSFGFLMGRRGPYIGTGAIFLELIRNLILRTFLPDCLSSIMQSPIQYQTKTHLFLIKHSQG
jgi:hypothetical protein